jgi:hypothetical protein
MREGLAPCTHDVIGLRPHGALWCKNGTRLKRTGKPWRRARTLQKFR